MLGRICIQNILKRQTQDALQRSQQYAGRRIRNVCNIPKICMNNQEEMPVLGLGTLGLGSSQEYLKMENYDLDDDDKPDQDCKSDVAEVVGKAIDMGYRHIDCAYLHKNEREIGKVLKQKLDSKAVKREELFITSKLWCTYHDLDDVEKGCKKALSDLNVDYLDMYLMHTPMAFKATNDMFPMKNCKLQFSEVDFICTWRAMEDLVNKKLCKSIGISNFNIKQVLRILDYAKIVPQTLQIELHPYLSQTDLVEFAKCRDICITAYAPLGAPKRLWSGQDSEKILIEEPTILEIAKEHNKCPAQILLRYQIQKGHAVIPKAENCVHLKQNLEVFDFELSPDNIESISCLNEDIRFYSFSSASDHTYHPFKNI